MNTSELETALAPLLPCLSDGVLRVVVRGNIATVERPEGCVTIETSLSASAFEEALGDLQLPRRLSSGATAVAVGDRLVLHRPPDAALRLDTLARAGWLSVLAARTLTQAVGLGRNVLVIGPWVTGVSVVAALVSDGSRPTLLGLASDAAPLGWPLLRDARDAQLYGADRIAAWSLDASSLGQLMGRCCGVVAWSDARTLPQALMRYECGFASQPAVHVSASLDLIVVTTQAQGPRVEQVFEIVPGEDGYRPVLLFSTGQAPVMSALVPVAVPSFVQDFERSGQSVLADELRHAVPTRTLATTLPRPIPTLTAESFQSDSDSPSPHRGGRGLGGVGVGSAGAWPARESNEAENAPPPGWELDQLDDAEVRTLDASAVDPEAAQIAASFGLAPPPRPPGMTEAPTNFAEALERVRRAAKEE